MVQEISSPEVKADAAGKIAGQAVYIGDMKLEGMLYAKTLRATEARAEITGITYPELPEGYYIVDKNDVPGRNGVRIVVYDMPFFADGVVNYIGEPIALVVGPDKRVIQDIISKIKVQYKTMEPIYSLEDGLKPKEPIYGNNNLFADYRYTKGDIKWAKANAEYTFEGEYETGYQEQFYLEPQGVAAEYKDGRAVIYGSIQCPYYVKNAVIDCLGVEEDCVRVVQCTTGGGFGGKEDYPSLIAGQAACAAKKANKPVMIILDRDEDVEYTTKRHPSKIKLKTYLDREYRILGTEADIVLDGGAYASLSAVVLQRAMFAMTGAYNIKNMDVKGRVAATNKAVSGAFRGFGAPQAFFAIEMHIEHMAKELKIDPMEFRMLNIAAKGDSTSTGGVYRDNIPMRRMIERAMEMSSYKQKKEQLKKERENGKLKGIGMSLFFHGGGFTGNGERDMIKAVAGLLKHQDGTVEILAANVDMGQGAGTTLRKIAANGLGIPIERVIYNNPDTDRVPDSGPTVASRTTMVVGKLIYDAALKLKERWDEEREVKVLTKYQYPEGFEWDAERFIGDAYTAYSWGVNVVEAEVDPITFEPKVKRVWAVYDIGCPIDERIAKGQIDGGILQGIGYGGMEVMETEHGRFVQRTGTDYIIPTSMDAVPIESQLICEPYKYGPYGAKALGELTLVGAPPAYAIAVEDALNIRINSIPIRPEHLMEVIKGGK